jgi:hypothetical protein
MHVNVNGYQILTAAVRETVGSLEMNIKQFSLGPDRIHKVTKVLS